MNNLSQKIWTYQLSAGNITIDSSYELVIISFTLLSGTGYYQGSALANGAFSTPVNLSVGQSVTISGDGNIPLDTFLISTTGVIAIIGRQ